MEQLDLVQVALSVPPDRTTDFTTASSFPADVKLVVQNFREAALLTSTPSRSSHQRPGVVVQQGRPRTAMLSASTEVHVQPAEISTSTPTSPGSSDIVAASTSPQKSVYHIFIASSVALCNGTTPWAAMLSGRFPHPTLNDFTLLDFTQDDYGALVILMRIVHYQWASVPRSMSLDKLYDLCLLSDRYMATKLLAPWIENWSAPVREAAIPKSVARSPGNGVAVAYRQGGFEQKKVWIAWELGMSASFAELVKGLCGRLWIDREGRRWIGPAQKDHKPPTKGWFEFAVRSRNAFSEQPVDEELGSTHSQWTQAGYTLQGLNPPLPSWYAPNGASPSLRSVALMDVLPLEVEGTLSLPQIFARSAA
jgi:hypothetical protein